MRLFSLILILIIIVIGVIFAMLNHATVQFNYFFGQKELALSLLLALTFFVGMFFGWVIGIPARLSRASQFRQLRKSHQQVSEQLKQHKQVKESGE